MGANEEIISIVCLTMNGFKDTRDFFNSLIYTMAHPFELIFVDNDSSDKTIPWIKNLIKNVKKYEKLNLVSVRLIETHKTTFSQAVNIGIKESVSATPIVCNNDIVFIKQWYYPLIHAMKNSDYTLLVPTTNYCGQPRQWFPSEDCVKPVIIPSPDVNFVCFIIRKSFWMEHKLDENYVSGVEDVDYCWTIDANGGRFGVHLGTFVYHKGEQTNKREFGEGGMNTNHTKGWTYFAKKWGEQGKKRANIYFNGRKKLKKVKK